MKKTTAIFLFFGCITSVSAQLLSRSETVKENKQWIEKHFYVNLDTMPTVKFISVNFDNYRNKLNFATISIGDSYSWEWIDATLKPIETRGYVDGLNKFSQFNWTLQMPVYSHWISEGSGSLRNDWLFKRKE